MLERKKLILETDVRETENDARIRFYEDRASGDVFIIRDPNLHLDEVEQVQQDVGWLLEGKDPEEERRKLEAEAGEQPSAETETDQAQEEKSDSQGEEE